MKRMGGIALRFTRLHGDLTTPEGINKLWSWVMMYEPEHIWVAPECKFWDPSRSSTWVEVLPPET